MAEAYDELETKIGAYAAFRARWRRADRLLAAMQLSDDIGQLTYKVLVLRRAEVRRGSARQPDQRQAPAGPDPVRQGEPGQRLVQPRAARDSADHGPAMDEGRAGAGDVPLRARGSLSPAGARARREGRAPALAGQPLFLVAQRRVCGALDRRRQASDDQAVDAARDHADLRAVPRDSRDQPEPGRPRRVVRGVPPGVRRQRQHLRVALQRRPAARLVPLAVARLQDDARRRAARQQHSAGGRRKPDRVDQGGHRAAAPLPSAAQARARPRDLPQLRRRDSARRLRSQVSVRGRPGMAAGIGRAARAPVPGAHARRARRAAGSTSTRTPASAAARTRRRSTACIRTCC